MAKSRTTHRETALVRDRPDSKRTHHKKVVGTVEQYADEHSARRAVVGLLRTRRSCLRAGRNTQLENRNRGGTKSVGLRAHLKS
jgi:hypothetical protein